MRVNVRKSGGRPDEKSITKRLYRAGEILAWKFVDPDSRGTFLIFVNSSVRRVHTSTYKYVCGRSQLLKATRHGR